MENIKKHRGGKPRGFKKMSPTKKFLLINKELFPTDNNRHSYNRYYLKIKHLPGMGRDCFK